MNVLYKAYYNFILNNVEIQAHTDLYKKNVSWNTFLAFCHIFCPYCTLQIRFVFVFYVILLRFYTGWIPDQTDINQTNNEGKQNKYRLRVVM